MALTEVLSFISPIRNKKKSVGGSKGDFFKLWLLFKALLVKFGIRIKVKWSALVLYYQVVNEN
jgi:hypothetical protein